MTTETFPLERHVPAPHDDSLMHVAPDVAGMETVMVNLYFIGDADDWVLVDAGLPMSAGRIIHAAQRRFGSNSRPNAIILTHGHFDHVGSLAHLADHWDVPIFAHALEMPYLTGKSSYPPPDPTVGGGMFARLSPMYPRHAYDFRPRISELPSDGSVPGAQGWRWIHTPGHSPGHVSLFRDEDRTLVAGDAFVTQKQESFIGVMTHSPYHVKGPPAYFTINWGLAKLSVQKLAALQPISAGTGHGLPMAGDRLQAQLDALALHFDELGVPRRGRYVSAPALADETGVVWLPPTVSDPVPKIAAAVAVAGIAALVAAMATRHGRHRAGAEDELYDAVADSIATARRGEGSRSCLRRG
jgi:glyoxylase-like metal-dependent hydrolase (beta-lactamase superfamily II)